MNSVDKKDDKEGNGKIVFFVFKQKRQLITACGNIGVPKMLTGKKVYRLYRSLHKILSAPQVVVLLVLSCKHQDSSDVQHYKQQRLLHVYLEK
jgi:hypothetical protein